MTSKEAFERIKEYCNSETGMPYRAYTNSYGPMNEDLDEIEKDLKALSIIKRIIKDNEMNYINPEFADGRKLYIDGCVDYDEGERDFICEWIAEAQRNHKNS